MRKITLLLGIVGSLLTAFHPGQGAWISAGNGPQNPALQVERADESGVQLRLEFSGLETEAMSLGGQTFERLSFEGSGIWGNPGQPELPVLRKLVLLPERAGWRWEVSNADYVEISGYNPAPLQEEIIESPDGPVTPDAIYDQDAYRQDRWYPGDPVELGRPVIMGGFRLGQVELRPVQFNPARGLLRIYRSLTINVTFEGEGENPVVNSRAHRSRYLSDLVRDNVINPPPAPMETGEVLGGYLFITPPGLQSSLETLLVEWKKEKGFPCAVYNTNQTGTSTTQIKSYIQNIYNTWPVPPDFLVLVGDSDYGMPTFTYSGSGDASDLPYTLLEGSDYFPDMLAGRLSVDSGNELAVVCTKIRSYEKDPYMTSPGWFTRGLVVYDYSGSESCRTTKERCAELMLLGGYSSVDRVTNPPTYNGATPINNAINNGVTFVNYRGYGSYSSWTPPNYSTSNINQLSNGFKLPVVTSIVCGGGNFASTSYDPCFGEGWIRYGTTSAPKGAVGFVGPTSLYTHTKWNNCIDAGIYQGIFEEGIGDFGSAVLRGKMELYYGMPNNLGPGSTTNSVECYFHIYNILGDPGLEMWTAEPAMLSVMHPATLAQGVNSFDLSVTSSGSPVEGALVCVYNAAADYQETAWTDENGEVLMDLAGAPAGAYVITVTGHDLKTYQGTLTISQLAVALGIDSFTIDDDMSGESSGDGDGLVNPGETIELGVVLKNTGSSQTATGITGTISSDDPYLTITQNSLTGPNAAPGATSPLTDDFNLVISNEAPHSHVIQVSLVASCGQGSWTNLVNLSVVAPLAEAVDYAVQNSSGILNPGETANVTVELLNSGGDPLSACSATLSSPDPMLTVTDSYGNWGSVAPGASAFNTSDPFGLHAASDCPPGWAVPLQLIVTSGIYSDTLTLNFTIGEVTLADPAGPDEYGYRCFDSRDLQYVQAPTYDWIEASSQPGHVQLNLPDYGTEQDCSVLQNLPFTFRYYGQDYTQITVCSNGWIAMGAAYMPTNVLYDNPRNWNIPGAQGPCAMIAPFWDDLRMDGASAHFWNDAANHRVVVEWKDVHTHYGWGVNRFEVILNDPVYYPTSTGDGEIIFQYYTFNNVDGSENYCTIGIENVTQSDGVKVTYANYYTLGSATLTSGVALKFSTDIEITSTTPDVQVTLTPYGTPIQIPVTGGSFDYNIAVANNESSPVSPQVWCDVTLPNQTIYGPVLGPVVVSLGAGGSANRDRTQAVPGSAPSGTYHYNAYVGAYPSAIWDSTSFSFIKMSTGYDTIVNQWQNYGDAFPGETLAASPDLPQEFALLSARPNPFNPTTTISFALPRTSHVKLTIYDLRGRTVASLVDGTRDAGVHQVTWDASAMPSGLYFYRLEAGDFRAVGKMVLVK